MFQRILVGYDGSQGSKAALARALSLVKEFDASVCALSVEGKLPRYAATLGEVEEVERERHEYFDALQVEAVRLAREWEVPLDTCVAPGPAAETIVQHARDGGYDLIVLGHKGHSRLHQYIIGATTDRVAHLAPCSVLIVRERSDPTLAPT